MTMPEATAARDIWDSARRVEEMVAEGLRICREAIEEYKPVAVVAAYSGGDDSIVSTHFAVENLPGVVVFNADTRIGLGPAREHIARTCERFRWTLEVGMADPLGPPKRLKEGKKYVPFDPARLPSGRWVDGGTAYEEFSLNFGFPGRGKPQHARMYQRLKERSIRALCRSLQRKRGEKVLLISGIRSDESTPRAGYRRAVSANGREVWVNPFYWRTAADFAAYRDEFGLPPNPVKPRCGISGECGCLTYPDDTDGRERDRYAEIDPAFGRYIDGLESRVRSNGYPWGYGQSPPKAFMDVMRGQGFLLPEAFDDQLPTFQPMCVGCRRGKR